MSDIVMTADAGNVTLLALLDLSAAFDTVDQAILLQRWAYHSLCNWEGFGLVSELFVRQISVSTICWRNVIICPSALWCSSGLRSLAVTFHHLHVWHSWYYCIWGITLYVLCWWHTIILSLETVEYAGCEVASWELYQPCSSMVSWKQTSFKSR